MTTLTAERPRIGWGAVAGWVIGNVIGWVALVYAYLAIGWGLGEAFEPELGLAGALALSFGLAGLVGGALLGALQAAVLRGRGVSPARWIAATAAGLAVSFSVVVPAVAVIDPQETLDPRALALLLAAGLILALAQWATVRRAQPRSWVWLPAGALGLWAAFLAAFWLGGEGRELLAALAAGLVYALATGAALAWIGRR